MALRKLSALEPSGLTKAKVKTCTILTDVARQKVHHTRFDICHPQSHYPASDRVVYKLRYYVVRATEGS